MNSLDQAYKAILNLNADKPLTPKDLKSILVHNENTPFGSVETVRNVKKKLIAATELSNVTNLFEDLVKH